MDHAYTATLPFHPLPPEITSTGARIVSFLHSGGRSVVLVGPRDTGKTSTLDAVLAGMPAWVERVSNRIPQPLTLERILAQVGAIAGATDTAAVDPAAGPDLGTTLARVLADRAGPTQPAVLAIDDAHTLTPDALIALAQVPGLGGPDLPGMVLLLSGEPSLLGLLRGAGLGRLRGAATLTLHMPARPGSPAAADPGAADVSRRWPYMASAVAVTLLAGALLLRPAPTIMPAPVHTPALVRQPEPAVPEPAALARPTPTPLDAAPAPVLREPDPPQPAVAPPTTPPVPESQALAPQEAQPQAVTPPAPMPPPDPMPTLDTAPQPAPEPPLETDTPRPLPGAAAPKPGPTEAQLRRDFDAFLNRAGRDTAHLTPPAREALFREYMQWRARPAP